MNEILTILINYNGINDTIGTIESLRKSTFQTDILVVDNASMNNEGARLRSICSDITVIQNAKNVGFAAANNIGIKIAFSKNYKYVLILNNDVEVETTMIEEMLKCAKNGCVVAPLMYYYSKRDVVWFGGGRINKQTGASEHFYMNRKYSGKSDLVKCSFLTGCCMMIPMTVIEKVGCFDESYFMYAEDNDYSIRLLNNNIPMIVNTKAILWHKVGMSTGGGYNMFNTYYNTRNRLLCIKKHKEYFNWTALIITYFTRIIRMIQFRLMNKQYWVAVLWGISDAFKNIDGQTRRKLRG